MTLETTTSKPKAETAAETRMHSHIDAESAARITAFLSGRGEASLSHDPAWVGILSHGLGHRCYYLEEVEQGRTAGVLPLALVQSWLFGRYLVSLPYLNQGGPVAESEETAARLLDRATALSDELDVRYLELRNRRELSHPSLGPKLTSKVLMHRPLPESAEELWKSFKPEVRNLVRKGEKNGLSVEWGRGELLADFYDVFTVNMRDLGTPPFGKRLFASILDGLGDRAELCVTRSGPKAIAAALLLHGDGVTEVPSASSLRAYNKTGANMLMYHELLKRALERGQRTFDFGRSSEDSSTYRFKKQWGAQPQPSVWQYYLRQGDVSEMRPDNDKYRRKIETWKRLPVWLTRLIGPSIIRGVP